MVWEASWGLLIILIMFADSWLVVEVSELFLVNFWGLAIDYYCYHPCSRFLDHSWFVFEISCLLLIRFWRFSIRMDYLLGFLLWLTSFKVSRLLSTGSEVARLLSITFWEFWIVLDYFGNSLTIIGGAHSGGSPVPRQPNVPQDCT